MGDETFKPTEVLSQSGAFVRRDLDKLRLLVVDGPDAGRSCLVGDQNIWVGTDPQADLTLVDGTVSRRHLQARKAEEGVWIQDQDSTNGTFYEESRVKEMVVGLGRVFRVGSTCLKVVPHEESLAPEPVAENHFHGMMGTSQHIRGIFATCAEVASTDLTVLITGETGTGKEALAEAIHRASSRSQAPLTVVDCTTIPRELAESELFGHRKGAFTGAVADRTGCFEMAKGGTIFIDEVGDLPLELQPKLLRVLERRQVKPVGSAETIEVDVRVIAASNQDLKEAAAQGLFREDLYYRLAVISLGILPLRERPEDLPLLVSHFLGRTSGGKLDIEVPQSALQRLQGYPWPGNVRELRNMVERAHALCAKDPFSLDSFVSEIIRGLGEVHARSQGPLPFKQAKSEVIETFERTYLKDLIERNDGNVSAAAREARLDRHHLSDLLKKHGIKSK